MSYVLPSLRLPRRVMLLPGASSFRPMMEMRSVGSILS
jgi:hypothetical protein